MFGSRLYIHRVRLSRPFVLFHASPGLGVERGTGEPEVELTNRFKADEAGAEGQEQC